MVSMVPEGESLKIEMYANRRKGLDKNYPIEAKPVGDQIWLPEGIDTEFKLSEIELNRNNPSKALISLLMWMMLEPNIFSVITWGSNNFLYLDIYNLFDQSYIEEGTVDPDDRIEGSLVWGNIPGFTESKLKEFKERFGEAIKPRDIMYFLGFHNHQTDSRYNNIIDYIKDKILNYFKDRGILDQDTDLIELR